MDDDQDDQAAPAVYSVGWQRSARSKARQEEEEKLSKEEREKKAKEEAEARHAMDRQFIASVAAMRGEPVSESDTKRETWFTRARNWFMKIWREL